MEWFHPYTFFITSDIYVQYTGYVEDPQKRKRFQPKSEKFGTSFSQSSVVVQENYIPLAKILIS